MKRKTIISVFVLLVIVMLMAFQWLPFAAWVEMRKAVWDIQQVDAEKPISSKKIYGVNTYTDECSTKAIRDYYHSAARALRDKSPDAATYVWFDPVLFYARVSTVLSTSGGYIEAVACHNNDNNSVAVIFSDQPFSDKERVNMKKLEGYELREDFPPKLFSER